jgi:hypothetical protein
MRFSKCRSTKHVLFVDLFLEKGEKSGSRTTHNEGGGNFRFKCFEQWLATHMARTGAFFEELDTGSM